MMNNTSVFNASFGSLGAGDNNFLLSNEKDVEIAMFANATPRRSRVVPSAAMPPTTTSSGDDAGDELLDILDEVEQVLQSNKLQPVSSSSSATAEEDDDAFSLLSLDEADEALSNASTPSNVPSSFDFVVEPTPLASTNNLHIVDQVQLSSSLFNTVEPLFSINDAAANVKKRPPFTMSSPMPVATAVPVVGSIDNLLTSTSNKRRKLEQQATRYVSMDNIQQAAGANSKSKNGKNNSRRYRLYQAEQWCDRLQEFINFKNTNGHCMVPHKYPENPALAQWVKRQRYQYKLKSSGRHSTLSDERQNELESLGFVWDSHKAAWDEKFVELYKYYSYHGNSNVPTKYKSNPTLAIWVKSQRRQYKLFTQAKANPANADNASTNACSMTQERIDKLNSIGFVWNPLCKD